MAQYPNVAVFQRVTADLLNSMYEQTFVKAALSTVTSSTTLANDSELVNIALAVGTWRIEVLLMAGGAATGDIKTAWAFSGTLTGTPNRACVGPAATNTATPDIATPAKMTQIVWSTSTSYGLASTTAFDVIKEECFNFVVATAGNFSVQWAQVVSDGTGTTVQAGSRVVIRQIG